MKPTKCLFMAATRCSLFALILGMGLLAGCHPTAMKADLRPFNDSILVREVKFRLDKTEGIKQEDLKQVKTAVLLHELDLRKKIRIGRGPASLDGHGDERTDLYDFRAYFPELDQRLLDISTSVPALIPKKYLKMGTDGFYRWDDVKAYYKAYEFCDPHVRFGLQPSCAIGTGFVVSDTQVATAAHCFDLDKYTEMYVVFGYQMESEHKYPLKMIARNVYEIASVKFNRNSADGRDVAIITVKGKFPAAIKSLQFRTAAIGATEELYAYGYPQGIPLKFISECKLMPGAKPTTHTFKAKGDIFAGNSGSPLVDGEGKVVGMILGGGIDTDTYKVDDCAFIFNCDLHKGGTCLGEVIQQATTVRNSITQ